MWRFELQRVGPRLPLYTALLGLLALISGPVSAQGDLLRRAQGLLGGNDEPAESAQSPTENEIGGGLKEALRVGAESVLNQLGATGGFSADPIVHIGLPNGLDRVKSALDRVGMGQMLEDLELRLNRAAEMAMPKAQSLFVQAIDEMTLEDVANIYRGPDDAATRYFQGKMSDQLALEMRPVVDESLGETGAAASYSAVMDRYNSLRFVRPVEADLGAHVVQMGMDGVFHYLAQEEAAIRNDPVKRTTELLQRVFGN